MSPRARHSCFHAAHPPRTAAVAPSAAQPSPSAPPAGPCSSTAAPAAPLSKAQRTQAFLKAFSSINEAFTENVGCSATVLAICSKNTALTES